MANDAACISNWLPALEAGLVPVPRTELVLPAPDVAEWQDLAGILDGQQVPGVGAFLNRLLEAAGRVSPAPGAPVFLRTGHTSGKHAWKYTCWVEDRERIGSHVARLIEYSVSASLEGLPWDVWAVREPLPVQPVIEMRRYGSLPLVAEFRAFVGGGAIKCLHPYWPMEAIRLGLTPPDKVPDPDPDMWYLPDGIEANDIFALSSMVIPEDVPGLMTVLQLAAEALAHHGSRFGEAREEWSVDVLRVNDPARPWVVIDAAPAGASFHAPECPRVGTE